MINKEDILIGTDAVDMLTFQQVEKRYTHVMIINTAVTYIIAMLFPLGMLIFDNFGDDMMILVLSVVIIALMGIINIAVTGKACRFKGYALRDMDITYRKGIFFHKIITIPFSKVQQVSISQGPVARLFSLYSIDIYNGSAWQSSITIPGLTQARAEQIKEHITNKLSNAAK